ncbi:MAG: mandelate racemase/muconate lactonizing enzyme family protein [Chloroflexota bacterium]
MKIDSHEIDVVDVPLERPFLSGGTVYSSALRHVILTMRTDEGVTGLGWGFSHSHVMLRSLRTAVEEVATHLQGQDPMCREAVQREIDRVTRWAGPGMTHWISAMVNFALYDIAGKALGQPVYRLLGANRTDSVPCYASGWLWRDYTLDELYETAGQLRERGFRAMKFRCGAEERASAEGERARAVRSAVGDEFPLMVDINEGWNVPRTMEVARHFEKHGVFWLEDPLDHRDIRGYRQLTDALDIAITHGEYNYGYEAFRRIMEADACDIAMIDAHHAGGIDAWRKAAAVCDAAMRPVVTHLSPEINVHLAAATRNCMTTEYMPWSFGLFEESMEIDAEGRLLVPQAPGLGVTLNRDMVDARRVDE